MSRRTRQAQTDLADWVEWQRDQEVSTAVVVHDDRTKMEKVEDTVEGVGIGYVVMTILRGIF